MDSWGQGAADAAQGDAESAASRVLIAASSAPGPAARERALVREARAFTGASTALLLESSNGGQVKIAAADPDNLERRYVDLDNQPLIRDALDGGLPMRVDGGPALRLAAAAGLSTNPVAALLLPGVGLSPGGRQLLVLADERPGAFSGDEVEAAAGFAAAAAESLARLGTERRGSGPLDRRSAMARAAKALNESLDLSRVLPRICEEAASILEADVAGVYRGGTSGLVLEATNLSHELIGSRVEPGSGIAGRVMKLGRPLMTGDADAASGAADEHVKSALAAPMRWEGELRGVLYVGYHREQELADDDLALLESFAELAAIACRNASVHAELGEAARKDALTGCLNHAALQDTLRREMQRSRRTGRRLSIVLVDLDHFKDVNEQHGHLMGDEVLRRVGRALREAVRPYDFVARYGGDEFAIVAVDAREERAIEIAERAIGRLSRALDEVLGATSGPHATAGVAEWRGGSSASDLIREADRALLYGKQQGVRGAAASSGDVPESFLLGAPPEGAAETAGGATAPWPSAVRRETEPLRRRARQLALAGELGARIAGMTRTQEIAEAVVTGLDDAFDLDLSAVVRVGAGGALETIAAASRAEDAHIHASEAAARCVSSGESVVIDDEAAAAGALRSLAAVPVEVDGMIWGAIDARRIAPHAFPEPDVRLLEAVSQQLGGALRSATRYEDLELAYLRTSELLTATLEGRGAQAASRARAVAESAEAVGRRLGMSAEELHALRYAAVFHDIGNVVVPAAILHKSGPLTDTERQEVERHAIVGEEMLAPVRFLDDVRPLIRHAHERWDGQGYPDGLAGERIPSGARILGVCDAHHSMCSDRPYRRALSAGDARAELAHASGSQFDARVVEAFLALTA